MAYLYSLLLLVQLAAQRVVAQSANGTVLNIQPDQYLFVVPLPLANGSLTDLPTATVMMAIGRPSASK